MDAFRTQPEGLDLTTAVRRLCETLCREIAELRHIAMPQVAVRICQTRRAGPYGVQATMTPLRFAGGSTTTIRRGRPWVIHPIPRDADGREYLYLLSLYVPRFLDLPGVEKVSVVVHELWHISPHFDGDLRRFPGRYHAHGGRCDRYHDEMRDLTERWLKRRDDRPECQFLEGDFEALRRRFGRVFGLKMPTPRLWRVDRLPKRDVSAA